MKTLYESNQFIIEYCNKYPKLQVQDILKTLHQSVFGCGHFVTDNAYDYLCKELTYVKDTDSLHIEALDGNYSRIYLNKHSLLPETIFKIFVLSSKYQTSDVAILEDKLNNLLKISKESDFPFSYEEVYKAVNEWKTTGYNAMHHSEEYNKYYEPHYRVVHNDLLKILPILTSIDKLLTEKKQVNVAIEGGSATGKTTLSGILSKIYDCNIFHMDDFFLRPEQRTSERLNEPGGNVDRERFLEEILLPLSKNFNFSYAPFDCSTQSLSQAVDIHCKQLNIIEGAYCLHPDLQNYYDLKVFLKIDKETQIKRIKKRNTPFLQERFFNEWIPMENTYFNTFNIENLCDLIMEIN